MYCETFDPIIVPATVLRDLHRKANSLRVSKEEWIPKVDNQISVSEDNCTWAVFIREMAYDLISLSPKSCRNWLELFASLVEAWTVEFQDDESPKSGINMRCEFYCAIILLHENKIE
jgi:hypothetical protein